MHIHYPTICALLVGALVAGYFWAELKVERRKHAKDNKVNAATIADRDGRIAGLETTVHALTTEAAESDLVAERLALMVAPDNPVMARSAAQAGVTMPYLRAVN